MVTVSHKGRMLNRKLSEQRCFIDSVGEPVGLEDDWRGFSTRF